ncbi:hypothetical protein HWV62_22945 [Athelia sp. TMB]|nr:hypothetical protein HWV62_22945 [Athelia sp. TMB]
MSAFTFMRLFSLFYALVSITRITAAPIIDARHGVSEISKRSDSTFLATAPYFTIYNDHWVAFPSVDDLAGYNVFAISFYLLSGATDQAQDWAEMTAAQRSAIKTAYNAAGISLIVSAFGSSDNPASSGADPTTIAQAIATWVTTYDLDGVDVDFEDETAFNKGDGSGEQWLITFTTALRAALPSGQYLISHAREFSPTPTTCSPQLMNLQAVAPWFEPAPRWGGGGYLLVDQKVGSMIDFYNVQFYNQGVDEYVDCAGLLTTSSSAWPNTALFQIIASGIPSDKLLIGKPGTAADATNGYVDPTSLATCVAQAVSQGWHAGVMVWQFPDAGSAWIETVRGTAFPVGGGGAPSTTISASSTAAPTSTSKSASTSGSATTTSTSATATPTGSCSGVAAWSSGVAYLGGAKATYNGHLWTASYWTEDDTPGDASGVWVDSGAC